MVIPKQRHFLLLVLSLLMLPGCLPARAVSARLSTTTVPLPWPSPDDPYASSLPGVAVDGNGNVFALDGSNGLVIELTRTGNDYSPRTVVYGLTQPGWIAVDAAGNLYITEAGGKIFKATPSAKPLPEYQSWPLAQIPVSGLNRPSGIGVDRAGNVYIANTGHNAVLKLTFTGSGYVQSVLPTSALGSPQGVAVDTQGNVFIADENHGRLLKETPAQGSYTESVADAVTIDPQAVAVDGNGNLFLLTEHGALWQETPEDGGYVRSQVLTPPGTTPVALAVDNRQLYLSGVGATGLARLVSGGAALGDVTNAAEVPLNPPVSLVFSFLSPGSIAAPVAKTLGVAASDSDFYDAGTGTCTTQGKAFVYAPGDTCSVDVVFLPRGAGTRLGAVSLVDLNGNLLTQGNVTGTGDLPVLGFAPGVLRTVAAGLIHPQGVAVLNNGDSFYSESQTGRVYRHFAGGGADTIIAQRLDLPAGLAVDGYGNVFVACGDGIYRLTPSGGGYLASAVVLKTSDVLAVAVDGTGYLYFISSASGDAHQVDLSHPQDCCAIGSGIDHPTGLAVDSDGNILVSDGRQGKVYRETLRGNGSYAQSVIASGLNNPTGIAAMGNSFLYVAASGGTTIYQFQQQRDQNVAPNGVYTQTLQLPAPANVASLALDARQNLFLTTNTGNGTVNMLDLTDPPTLTFPRTSVGAKSAAQAVIVSNLGPVGIFEQQAPAVSSGFLLSSDTTCSAALFILSSGDSCLLSIEFAPTGRASYSGTATPGLSEPGYLSSGPMTISLRGSSTVDATRTTMQVSHNPVMSGLGVTLTVTVTDTVDAATAPSGTVTITDTYHGVATTLNGGTPLTPLTLSGGKASLSIVAGAAGNHTITAHYNGVDASFTSSTFVANMIVQ